MRKVFLIIIFAAVCILFSRNTYGNTVDYYLEESLERAGIENIEASEELNGKEITFTEAVRKILAGEIDISVKGAAEKMSSVFSREIKAQAGFIKKIIVVALLSALLKNISDSFKEKSVSDLSFFVCYIVLVIFIMSAFRESMDLVRDTSDRILDTMQAMLPA